tara:strand:+ start:1916 stop:2365 length:450 start_codon:yes stop_codon:yes gene_type:complete
MAKTQSFGDKVKKDSNEEKFTTIKYIRSVISEKTGKNRFVEGIYKIPASESMDSFLKKVDNPEEELKVDEIKVDKVEEVKNDPKVDEGTEVSSDVQTDVKSPKEVEVNTDDEAVEVKPDLEKPATSNELNKSEDKPLDDKKESKEEVKK